MSDFDDNEMQIPLPAAAHEGADPFGLLNDVLRDALRSESNRDYGVFGLFFQEKIGRLLFFYEFFFYCF